VTSSFYDLGGRLVEVADPLGRTSSRAYDDHGRLRRVEDPAGNVSVVDFDESGNPVKRTDSEIKPDGSYESDRVEQSRFDALNRTVQSLDPLAHATLFAYDEPGNLLSVTDALSHKTSYAYDERGRRLSMVDGVGNAGAPDQHKTQWAWDRSSRMLSMTDAEGRATTYGYDAIGRLLDIGYPDNQHETRTWNGDGTVATSTDQNGTVSTFAYGPDDQPEAIAYTRGVGVVGLTSETFSYDKLGRLTSASSNAGIGGTPHVTSRAYDSLDRMLSETQDATSIARAFDLVGNPTGLTLPGSNRSFARSFDALDRLSQYDELLDPEGTTRRTVRAFDYVGPNRIAAERVMGNLSTSYQYDTARRLTALTTTNQPLTKTYLDYVYGWNDDDVPAFEQRLHEGSRGDAYVHDEDHRLTLAGLSQATPTGPPVVNGRNQQAFTLGPVHERTNDALTLATVTTNRAVTSNARYGYTDYGPDTGRTYDKAGSLTRDAHGTYQWDARHRLVEADLADGTKLEYGYDALGRRVEKKKTVPGTTTTTTWLYDGWNATEEFRDGTLVRDTLYGAGLDDALELRQFGPTPHDFELLRDRTGSTAAIVADDGTAQQFKYLPFGKASLVDGSGDYTFDLSAAPTTSLWQGLDLDPDLNWYYARNRWYDPDTGSFASSDPLGYPDSANAYVWGIARPWVSDPTGLLDEGLTAEERDEIRRRLRADEARRHKECRSDALSLSCLSDLSLVFADTEAKKLPRIGGREHPNVDPIIFVNGIWNTRAKAEESGRRLSRHFKAPVDVLWNPTQNFFLDILQTVFVNKMGSVDASTRLVIEELRTRAGSLPPGHTLRVVAHSQGAAIVSTALKFVDPAVRSRIDLITYGEAASEYPEGLHSLVRHVNILDPVPNLAGGHPLDLLALTSGARRYTAFMTFPLPVPHPLEAYLDSEEYWSDPQRRKELEARRLQQLSHEEARH
jgi:RHS repeat-associated protein